MKKAENSPKVENTAGKRRHCLLQAISPFPTQFSKDLYSRHIKTRPVWEWVCPSLNFILDLHKELFQRILIKKRKVSKEQTFFIT